MSKSLFVLIGLVMLPAASSSAPVQWTSASGGNDHFYEIVAVGSEISWDDARAAAQAKGPGWDLATVTSVEEDEFIKSLVGTIASNPENFSTPFPNGNVSGPWLGGFRDPSVYEWVTGEPFLYTGWAPREPFGNGDRISYMDRQSSGAVGWNDIFGDVMYKPTAYVAEVVPEPTTALLLGFGLLGICAGRQRSA